MGLGWSEEGVIPMAHPTATRRVLAVVTVVAVLGGAALFRLRAGQPTDAAARGDGTSRAFTGVLSVATGDEGAVTAADAAAAGGVGTEDDAAGAPAEAPTKSDGDGGSASRPDESGRPAAPSVVEADAFTQPYRDLEIAAEVGGVVAAVNVEEGDHVEEGQVLVTFKSEVLEAQKVSAQSRVAYAEVQVGAEEANCAVATREYDRMKGLFEENVISDQDFRKTALQKDQADWRVRAAQETLKVSKAAVELEVQHIEQTVVRAPISGEILRIEKRPGEAVEVYKPMLQMVQLDPLYVIANVPIDTYGRIRPGMKAFLKIPRLNLQLECKVVVVDNVANVGSETYRVKLALPNSDGAVAAGARGTIRFELSE
jgi:cobalt-zinc-cadmium efflux system membrane fusion protein